MAKEAYYFSHDANSRNDPKILSMMLDYGIEGYGMFWIVVENLREQNGYKLKQDKSTWRALAMQMHSTVDKVQKYINDCVNEYELFVTDSDHFYSESLMRRMNKREEVRESKRKAAKARWDKEKNTDAMHMHSNSNADEIQNYAKESKGNIKEKENKEVYRKIQHLELSVDEYNKLKETYTHEQINDVLDSMENWAKLKTKKSAYLTANNWLKRNEPVKTTTGKRKMLDLSEVTIEYTDGTTL